MDSICILNVEGSLFFGAATKFEYEVLEHIPLIRTFGICATCPYTAFRECAELKLKGVTETVEARRESM